MEFVEHKKELDKVSTQIKQLEKIVGIQNNSKLLKALKGASKLGEVLGPAGIAFSIYNLITSNSKEEYIQNGVDFSVDILGLLHPTLAVGSLAYSITRLADGLMAYATRKVFGEDYSVSTLYSEYMLKMDKFYSKYLFANDDGPEYTKSIFWKIAENFNL